jgi:hypothetical protein
MSDVSDASARPTIKQFFQENNAFIAYNVPKVRAQYQIPRQGGLGAVLEALRNSDDNPLTVKEVIEIYQDREKSSKKSSVEAFKGLLVSLLGVEDLKDYEDTRVDLDIARKLCGIEGDEDPSVAFCSENSYANLMLPLADGGFREVIENEIIRRFTNKNSGGGLGDKTKPVVFEALQHAGGKTVEEVCHSIDETLGETEDRHSENQRKSNIFKAIMRQLGDLEPENTIDESALRRILRIPEDGYSMAKAKSNPQEADQQQQGEHAMTESQANQQTYKNFLKENKAFLRYALSQQGKLDKIKNEDGLDVVLECLKSLGEKKTLTVGNLIREFDKHVSRSNNTESLKNLLSKALGRGDDNPVTGSDTTPLDLNLLRTLCGMKEGDPDPSVAACFRCWAQEPYAALLSPAEEGGCGEVIANEITRLARSSPRNQVGEKMLEIILGALPHIGGKSLSDADSYISLPKWGLELCARLNSDQDNNNEENSRLRTAVKTMLGIEGKISEGVFLRAIRSKPTLKGSLKIFHEELTSAMGSNVPSFLRWEEDDKKQQSTRTKGGNDFFRQSQWFGVDQQGTFDEKALLHVLGIPEDGYSVAMANQMIGEYKQQHSLYQG